MTRNLSLRWRLIAWYIAALLGVLVVFGGLMCFMMNRRLHYRIDVELAEEAKELAEEIRTLPSIEQIQTRFNQHYVEHGGYSFQICRLDGTVICGTPWLRAHSISLPSTGDASTVDSLQDITLSSPSLHRMIRRAVQGPSEPLVIHVLVPYAQTEREFYEFLQIVVMAGVVALFATCLVGQAIAHRVLIPLKRITSVAERISAENLSMTIAVENPNDELGRLAMTLNRTFQRLHASLDQIQQFTEDAAHELRTPLSVMRTRLEVGLRSAQTKEEYRDGYQVALEQAIRLSKLIDQLLLLSRHDAGIQTSLFEEVWILPLLQDVADSLRPTADAKGVSITIGEVPDCVVFGDDISLSRLLFNLIENSIKYTPADGIVGVKGIYTNSRLRLEITDSGIGIAAEHLPKIFNRFYRVDSSRSGQTGGAGLGLAICKSIVEAHRGEISVTSIVGQGTTFTIELPCLANSVVNENVEEAQYV